MRRKLIAAVPLAAASAVSALLLSPGVANAAPPTTIQLLNWAGGPPAPTSGSFTATSKTLCASGTWATGANTLTLTCSTGTISFAGGTGKFHGKQDGFFNVTSGNGAFAGATGTIWFIQDTGTTGIWAGMIS